MALDLTKEELQSTHELLLERIKATLLDDPTTNRTEVSHLISTLRKLEEVS